MTSCSQDGMWHYNKGINLLNQENYQKAVDIFSTGIALDDFAKSANHYGRAYAYFELNQLSEAKSDIEKSLKTEAINNEDINCNIYWLKGMIASEEGDIDLEIQSYQKAIEYNPNNSQLKTTLGYALVVSDRLNEAIDLLTKVINNNKKDAYAYNNRGLAYIKTAEYLKAKSDLDASKNLNNQNPFLYRNYFFLYQTKNDLEKACKALAIALQQDMSEYGRAKDTAELKRLKREFCN